MSHVFAQFSGMRKSPYPHRNIRSSYSKLFKDIIIMNLHHFNSDKLQGDKLYFTRSTAYILIAY